MEKVEKKFQTYLKEYQKSFNDKKYLLAVSGGVDSMVMLNLFLKFKLNFSVCSCNFNLRGIDSNSDVSVDRYYGRRESGITNTNIRKNSKTVSSNMDDNTQNAYMKTYSSRVGSSATRSTRSSSYQYSGRRLDSQNRLSSTRIEAINNSFSGNSVRSSRGTSSLSSIDNMSGRRSVYSAPANYNNGGSVFSMSGGSGRSSGFNSGSSSSSSSFSSYSSGGSSGGYSGGSRSSGGTSVVSSGSSGGSSRGNN